MEIPTIDKKKLGIISGGLLGVLILLVSLTALISSLRRNNNMAQNGKPSSSQTADKTVSGPTPLPLPKVQVAKWVAPAVIPAASAPSQSQVYSFKPVNPDERAAYFSQRIMGTNKLKKSKKGLLIATLGSDSGQDLSAFVYNPGKGEFSYASTRGILLPGSSQETPTERVSTLVNLLFTDPTLKVASTYKKKDKPGVTYYEVHRDWGSVGLPILNPFGLLNLPENESLTSLRLIGQAGKSTDLNIYGTSDKTDGKARATDFNSLTIGVKDDDNTVSSLLSNIREVEKSQLRIASIIPYEDAVAKLKNKEYTVLFTAPSGGGTPNFDKVYPENEGIAEQAEVKEGVVAYLEDMPANPQKALVPHYIFRGNTTLKSGYRVNFIAAVPATTGGATLGVSSQQRTGSQSQGSYTISPQPTVGPCGLGITCPSVTPSPTPNVGHCGTTLTCPPSATPIPPSPTPTLPPPCCATPPPPTATPTPPPPTPTPPCTVTHTCPTLPPPPPTATPTTPPPTSTPRPPSPTPPCNSWWTCLPTFPPVTPSPIPTIPPPDVSPTPPITALCLPQASELTNTRSISFTLRAGQLSQATKNRMQDNSDNSQARQRWANLHWGESINVGDWYSYSTTGTSITAEDITAAWSSLGIECNQFSIGGSNDCRSMNNIVDDLEADAECPIRITGGSPTIFVYGQLSQTIQIYPRSTVNYAEPGLFGKAWNVAINSNGRIQTNGVLRDYLYYEYKPISFIRPTKGWNISKNALSSFIQAISKKLALTSKEEERLNFEISQAASNVSADTLFVGLIDKKEINSKLPLSVTPEVNLQRIHFYVGEANASVVPPSVKPVQRSSSMVLEIGAAGE